MWYREGMEESHAKYVNQIVTAFDTTLTYKQLAFMTGVAASWACSPQAIHQTGLHYSRSTSHTTKCRIIQYIRHNMTNHEYLMDKVVPEHLRSEVRWSLRERETELILQAYPFLAEGVRSREETEEVLKRKHK